jgi:hypothetical protein
MWIQATVYNHQITSVDLPRLCLGYHDATKPDTSELVYIHILYVHGFKRKETFQIYMN